jgi:hypothetical protein
MKAMKWIFTSIYFLVVGVSNGQIFNYSSSLGSVDGDAGEAMVTDAKGNLYVTGYFSQTVDFDPGPGVYNLSADGMEDIFFAKYAPSGALIFARRIGGALPEAPKSIAVDGFGNIVLTGYILGPSDFDPANGGNYIWPTMTGVPNTFLAKYNNMGSLVWARVLDNPNHNIGNKVVLDAFGNVYLAGQFRGNMDMDPGPATHMLVAYSVQDPFIAKYTSAGQLAWAVNMGSVGYNAALSLALDLSGGVIATGYFTGTVDFDPGQGVVNLSSNGSNDIFVVKLHENNGSFIWAKSIGGVSSDRGMDVKTDGYNNVLLTGTFCNTVDFDPGSGVHNVTVSNTSGFLVKLNHQGDLVWMRKMDGSDEAYPKAMALDATGNIYLTGSLYGSIDFSSGAGMGIVNATGFDDIFLVKYFSNGNFGFAKGFGGTISDEGNGVAVDNSGGIYFTGSFMGGVDFSGTATGMPLFSQGASDGFLVKYDQISPLSTNEIHSGFSVGVYPNPAVDFIRISSGLGSRIRISDIFGRLIYDGITDTEMFNINVSSWAAGQYLVEVSYEDKTVVKKILKS